MYILLFDATVIIFFSAILSFFKFRTSMTLEIKWEMRSRSSCYPQIKKKASHQIRMSKPNSETWLRFVAHLNATRCKWLPNQREVVPSVKLTLPDDSLFPRFFVDVIGGFTEILGIKR